MIYFLDTNVILEFGEKVFDHIAISSETLRELEEIKVSRNKDEHVKQKARGAIRLLASNLDKYRVVIYRDEIATFLRERGLEETPDNKICACAAFLAQYEEVTFVTSDLSCQLIAKDIFGLKVERSDQEAEKIYKGYQLLKGNSAEILEAMSDPEFMSKFVTNEYLLTYNTDTDTEGEMRFDGEKFVGLKLPPSKVIKAKNALQRCALDLLNNQNITIVALLGLPGSGKSYLNLRYGNHAVNDKGYQSKMIAVREPISSGRESGFLPGELDSKIGLYFQPLIDQLDGGEFEFESLRQRGTISQITIHYIKGRTFNDSILLLDEAEDLTEKQIKLVGTRVGTNSRLFCSGDYKQSEINRTENNAYVKMVNALKGNSKFGTILLNEDVRSETSKIFADLFYD